VVVHVRQRLQQAGATGASSDARAVNGAARIESRSMTRIKPLR
jgi:hypothetical protein